MAGLGRVVRAAGSRLVSDAGVAALRRRPTAFAGGGGFRCAEVWSGVPPVRGLAGEGRGGGVFSDLHGELNSDKTNDEAQDPVAGQAGAAEEPTAEKEQAESKESAAQDQSSTPEDEASEQAGRRFDNAVGVASSFWTDLKDAANDLFTIDRERSVLTKRVHDKYSPPDETESAEGASSDGEEQPAYDGPSEIMVVDQGRSTWERLGDRLKEAPLYQELLRRAQEAQKSEFGQKATEATDKVRNRIENMQEAWETSQNPWVYRISEVWDSLTHETDTARVLKELRKMDPDFSLEVWKEDVSQHFVPRLLEAWLRGDTKFLKHWCQDDIYKKLFHDVKQREQEQVIMDPNILSVDFAEVIVDPSLTERNALLGLFVAVQQISCVRDKSGEIKEGAEDDIKLNKYFLVFQREYVMEDGELQWKVADFGFQGDEYIAI